ncbi:Pkinase-domain-containing protein [Clavulina sp. PMI_390]|nr:Pkinase-domain-containing protein [Clavulina sp. PMI_390]
MSWFGKGSEKESTTPSRSTTPMPQKPAADDASSASEKKPATTVPAGDSMGKITIRVIEAKDFALPEGITVSAAIDEAEKKAHARNASVNPRESLQRKKHWWLPYVVLEFEKNEVVIDALGGRRESPIWQAVAQFDVSRQSSEISISSYLRLQAPGMGERADMGNDILLSRLDLNPTFDPSKSTDQWFQATVGAGQFHLIIEYKPQKVHLTIEDFDLLRVIGKGSFGKVFQAKKIDTGRIYALKVIRKAHIASRPGEITHILAERTVLALVNNPFIVGLKFSFQNTDRLYLAMPLINGGELFNHLQREGSFDISRTKFYAAELLCALEHLHSFNVIYRDLKPENILLDYKGHIALCDFGLCKLNMKNDSKTDTFCGTPEYIAPELLQGKGYTRSVDWWTLGTLLYEFLTGLPPFYDKNTNTMYQKILSDPLKFPSNMPSTAKSIITELLQRDPTKRLGASGAEEIKRHMFFGSIDWPKLMAKKIQPPFKPSVTDNIDVSNFDVEFTSENPTSSVITDSNLSQTVQRHFVGFTYDGHEESAMNSVARGQFGTTQSP